MDVISFGLSWVLVFQQALQPDSFHASFLVLAAVMSGVPAAVSAGTMLVRRSAGALAPEPDSGTSESSTSLQQ